MMDRMQRTGARIDPYTPEPRSGLVTGARWTLAVLAMLFTVGAFGQFFLVGLSFFDDAARWKDHATLGHAIGLLPWLMWIPAILGRTGPRLIGGTLALFILFEAQYAFINIDNTVVNAFHPLNGSVLLVLGVWVSQRAIAAVRQPIGTTSTRAPSENRKPQPGPMERTPS